MNIDLASRARLSRRCLVGTVICAAILATDAARADDPLDKLRLSQVQVIGTHNSYHLAPDSVAAQVMQIVVPQEAAANDFSHVPLTDQLQRLSVRQIELDLFLDPEGKLYQQPAMLDLAKKQKVKVPPHDPNGLLQDPGIKILHSPDFDFRTTVYSLDQALREVKAWSDEHREHTPVFMLLELKSESFFPGTKPPAWDAAAIAQLEKQIEAVFPRERICCARRYPGDACHAPRSHRPRRLAHGSEVARQSDLPARQ